jgi:urea transport system permease protein
MWWRPFASFPFALVAGVLVPALVAGTFGFFIFRNRVRGVYFSIITQALAWGAFLAFSRNELLLGGTNGLTNFYKPLNSQRSWVLGLYLLTALALVGCFIGFGVATRSRAGRVLVAIRDNESRLRFFGYRPEIYKTAAFALAAMFAAIGGMLYVPQNGIITPNVMRVEDSLWMVIWVAVGGRGTRWGAVAGALLANFTYSILTSDMPRAWPFIQGGLFLAILIFPGGAGSLWTALETEVRSGARPGRVARAAIPLLTVALVVFLEAFDLLPRSFSMAKYVAIGTLITVYACVNSGWELQMAGMRRWVRHAD